MFMKDAKIMPKSRSRLRWLVLTALLAGLTVALSQIVIPIQPIPVSLATLAVLCAGGILGSRRGALSQLVFVLLGAVGLPVFAGFKGGLAAMAGPTGGFIAGYILAAFVAGLICERTQKLPLIILGMILGAIFYFTPGIIWFMMITKTDLAGALAVCVLPFLPGDAAKIALASALTWRLRAVLKDQ